MTTNEPSPKLRWIYIYILQNDLDDARTTNALRLRQDLHTRQIHCLLKFPISSAGAQTK